MAPFTCPYIKRDGTICGNKCWLPEGCYRHWKLYEKNSKKSPCLICGFHTDADLGYCSKNCSKYSAKFHSHNYRMRQKRKAETEALQPLNYRMRPFNPESLKLQFPSQMIIVLRSMNTCFPLLYNYLQIR